MKKESSSGFVYIWFDVDNKRYYVGSHWGSPNDGYICSSKWMRAAYNRRPHSFVRRILKTIDTNRHDLLIEEGNWLALIKDHELGVRYYNVTNHQPAHWSTIPKSSLTVKGKISKSQIGKKLSEEHKDNIRNSLKNSHSINPEPWRSKKASSKEAKENYANATRKKHKIGKAGIKGGKWYYHPCSGERIVIKDGDPPEGFIPGRSKLGNYFHNLKTGEEVVKFECPEGFVKGRHPDRIKKLHENRWKSSNAA